MTDKEEGEQKKEPDPKEDLRKEIQIPTGNPAVDDEMPTWQKQMWQDYTDDYSKQISEVCYNKEFKVLYNEIEGKNQDALLFTEPRWVPATLIKKNMSKLQSYCGGNSRLPQRI